MGVPADGSAGTDRQALAEAGVVMKIGIIGSGHIGGTLTRRLRTLGHDVTVTNSRGRRA